MRFLALPLMLSLALGAAPARPAVAPPRLPHADPLGLAVNKDGTQAYVALPDRRAVAVVDLVELNPAFDPDGRGAAVAARLAWQVARDWFAHVPART